MQTKWSGEGVQPKDDDVVCDVCSAKTIITSLGQNFCTNSYCFHMTHVVLERNGPPIGV